VKEKLRKVNAEDADQALAAVKKQKEVEWARDQYAKAFGLRTERASGKGSARIVLSGLDKKDPSRQFAFTVVVQDVLESRPYDVIEDCEPTLPQHCIDKALEESRKGDLELGACKIVLGMRKAFIDQVAETDEWNGAELEEALSQ